MFFKMMHQSPATGRPAPAAPAAPAARDLEHAADELERAKAAFRRRETTLSQLAHAWNKCPRAAREKRYLTIVRFFEKALDGVSNPRR